jgi:hypothetical protein
MRSPRSSRSDARLDLGQCRKQAKELLRGFVARDARALNAIRWNHPRFRGLHDHQIAQQRFVLADAQLVIARLQHIESWPKLLEYIESLRAREPNIVRFEQAVDAIVLGDIEALRALLQETPSLVHERSTRAHQSTLLHYISANGVEDVRQVTPPNIVDITRLLLDAGADVNATSGAYGGGSSTLMLTATSAHPRLAGVQIALMDLLIDRGAIIGPVAPGRGMARDAIANGCPGAAVHLIERGATSDTLYGAAGLGRLEDVERLFDAATTSLRAHALLVACQCNRTAVAEFLLSRGADAQAYDGMTPMHWAAANCNIALMERLLVLGADLERQNEFGGTVLSSLLWFAFNATDTEFVLRDYPGAIQWLVGAGANSDRYPAMKREIDGVTARAEQLRHVTAN